MRIQGCHYFLGAARQSPGAGGVCQDFSFAQYYSIAGTLRLADGLDEVHRNAIAKMEIGKLA